MTRVFGRGQGLELGAERVELGASIDVELHEHRLGREFARRPQRLRRVRRGGERQRESERGAEHETLLLRGRKRSASPSAARRWRERIRSPAQRAVSWTARELGAAFGEAHRSPVRSEDALREAQPPQR
jgi:hypothetical protein